jgi:hypothetical protein
MRSTSISARSDEKHGTHGRHETGKHDNHKKHKKTQAYSGEKSLETREPVPTGDITDLSEMVLADQVGDDCARPPPFGAVVAQTSGRRLRKAVKIEA